MAYLLLHKFHFRKWQRVAQESFRAEVAFQVEVPPVPVEVCRVCCASSVSADSLLCRFGIGRSRPYDFYKPLLGVFLSHLHLIMPRQLNSSLHLCTDIGVRFRNLLLRVLFSGMRKPPFGHFRHFQGKARVGLFKLYLTSLPRHSSWHVENLQGFSCCFSKEDSAITSTIYDSVASSKVFEDCFVHSLGPLSRNSSAKIPGL